MPDHRYMQNVSERIDIGLADQAGIQRVRRFKWSLLALFVPIVVLVAAALAGNQKLYWARPVASAHKIIENDCKQCHVEPLQSTKRELFGHPDIRGLENKSCRTCHPQLSMDHNIASLAEQTGSCFDCHREHQGEDLLLAVTDQHCVQCHTDLKMYDLGPKEVEKRLELLFATQKKETIHGVEKTIIGNQPDPNESKYEITPGKNFERTVTNFLSHPEFALLRTGDAAASSGESHQVHQVAKLNDKGIWEDSSNLKFNHKMHLSADGVLTASSIDGVIERKKLNCIDCHQTDSSGSYMQPINYNKHCAECHKLDFSKKLSSVGAPLPHVETDTLSGVIRDRLVKFIEKNPDRIEDSDPFRLPFKVNDDPKELSAEEKYAWVDSMMNSTQKDIFEATQQGCIQCHKLNNLSAEEGAEEQKPLAWKVRPTNVPDRWMSHSKFRHDRHDTIRCESCHYQTTTQELPPLKNVALDQGLFQSTTIDDDSRVKGSVYFSEKSSDILMPSIQSCKECHGKQSNFAVTASPAKSNCIECHDYHGHAETHGKTIIQSLMNPIGEQLNERKK